VDHTDGAGSSVGNGDGDSDSGEVENEDLADNGEGETDSEFYGSDYDVEDGDDDIFEAWVDKDVNENSEQAEIVEQEDDSGLEHQDLHLTKEQELEL
jgi:hypothetical protein